MSTQQAGSNEPEILRLWISLNHNAIDAYLDKIVGHLREAIAKILKEQFTQSTPSEGHEPSTAGVELPDQERLMAGDLRTALLLGKLPEDAGLLIDRKTAARLLNVSSRTLYRLHSVGATPDPLRIGGKIIRFRLAELLAWIEADCPPKKHWTYSQGNPATKRRK